MVHGSNESQPEVVVELASFRVAPGVTETDVLNASDVIQHEFLRLQPGFLRRDLLRAGDGGGIGSISSSGRITTPLPQPWLSFRRAQPARRIFD